MATEVKIPVPWGHIAAKCWGQADAVMKMIGVHGLQDNASTFDRLAPLLPSSFYFVSIDLPGHGLSSHLPEGLLYHLLDMVTVITRVVDHLGWKEFYYLGHSFGGQIGTYYASFHPERIAKLILLDVVRSRPLSEKQFASVFVSRHKKLLELEKKLSSNKIPCYSYEETKERLHQSRFSELTSESADILLKRSLRPHNGGYVFGQDQRLKFVVFPPHTNSQQLAILNNIRCPLLIIKARESLPIFHLKGVQDVLDMYRLNSAHFEEYIVEGNHDVHLNCPERVSPLINKFLLHQKSQL